MKLEEVDISRAIGMRLVDEIGLDNVILPKNHTIKRDDIIALKQAGYTTIFAATPENGDIDFDTALEIVCAKISGKNIGFKIDERGFCEIAATSNGVFDVSPERINKFNHFSQYFILNTILPYSRVSAGDVIARVEILVPIISQDMVDELIFNLSGNTSLLNVINPVKTQATLLYTKLHNDTNELLHGKGVMNKLVESYQDLNLNFVNEQNTAHTSEAIADTLTDLLHSNADIVFIISSQRNYTKEDVIVTALNSIVDEIVCQQVPVLGGSDLIIAHKKNKKIICLPYNYEFIDSPVLDNFITQAIIKEKLHTYDFNHSENAIITAKSTIKDLTTLIRDSKSNLKTRTSVAAIVLAAGQSKRLGKNKLLVDVDDIPMVLKTVRAVVKSKASPIFVVTGYQADEIEEILEDLDINIIYNPNYSMGIKTSINLGLKAVPNFCDGAMLIPADMPYITPETINKMIAKFRKKQEKQLITAQKNHITSNPIIWSKALYGVADLVPENADLRPVFMEHSDYTTRIVATEDELLDVNFKCDLDTIEKKNKSNA